MIITDEHVAKTAELLEKTSFPGSYAISPRAVTATRNFLTNCIESKCLDKIDCLILECLKLEYEHTVVPTPGNVTEIIERNRNFFYQTLFALLGPVYFLLGGRLPTVTMEEFNVIQDQCADLQATKQDIVDLHRLYNHAWADLISKQIAPLERMKTKVTLLIISKLFISKLHEPLEKNNTR